jgi:hypothetical protein
LASWKRWRPRGQQTQGKPLEIVLDGSCDHCPMIWRPSDMVVGLIGGRSTMSWWVCVVRCARNEYVQ